MEHDLGMTVVAEGVETPEQLRLLKQMERDEVQGFLFSRAVSGEAFPTLLSPKTCGPRDEADPPYGELAVQPGSR